GPRTNDATSYSLVYGSLTRVLGRERRTAFAFFSCLPSGVTCLFLTADGEHKHRVELHNVSIQRDITACTAANHKLSKIRSCRTTDQRIAFQHVDCPYDVFDA